MRRGVRSPVATALVAVALVLGAATVAAAPVGAVTSQDPMGPPSTTVESEPLPGQGPAGADCGPGNIVRFPDCGQEPASAGDPGGWLQVGLFFLVCAAVVGIGVGVWWRSRTLRDRRRAAGHDPVDVARAHGTGVRR